MDMNLANELKEQSTTDIWHHVCSVVRRALTEHNISPSEVHGIGFDATCSLCVFSTDTDHPVSVTGPHFNTDRNVILWLDHRAVAETETVNATGHKVLRYVGGKMSLEMEVPKILWLKNNMSSETFAKCRFYDLGDALTHIATGGDARSFSSMVCKQAYLPHGVEGSDKGWQEDFLQEIGLGDLAEGGFHRIGGVNGEVCCVQFHAYSSIPGLQANRIERCAFKRRRTVGSSMRKRCQRPRAAPRSRHWQCRDRCICGMDRHCRCEGGLQTRRKAQYSSKKRQGGIHPAGCGSRHIVLPHCHVS